MFRIVMMACAFFVLTGCSKGVLTVPFPNPFSPTGFSPLPINLEKEDPCTGNSVCGETCSTPSGEAGQPLEICTPPCASAGVRCEGQPLPEGEFIVPPEAAALNDERLDLSGSAM